MRQSIAQSCAALGALMLLNSTNSGCTGSKIGPSSGGLDASIGPVEGAGSADGGKNVDRDLRDSASSTTHAARDAGFFSPNDGRDAAPTPFTPQVAVEADRQVEGGAVPPSRIESGDSVFFVGNSFFGGNDDRLPDLVSNLGAAVKPAIVIHTGSHVVFGNHPLSWFLQQSESQDAIVSGRYKIFVLQGEEREPVEHVDAFKQAVRDYNQAVTAHGGGIMLFMTWDFIWEKDTTFFQQLSTAYEELGRELNVPVIPVGLIYDDCNKQPFGSEQPYSYWLNDALHQNQKGTVVNTYATFAMLTGVNPMGLPVGPAYYDPVPAGLYEYLSNKTWDRVAPRLAK